MVKNTREEGGKTGGRVVENSGGPHDLERPEFFRIKQILYFKMNFIKFPRKSRINRQLEGQGQKGS